MNASDLSLACSTGEKMAALCREFDVSRKTGYKIFQRYKDCGLDGLTDRSRRPYRHANRLPFQIEKLIVQLKRERPSWGAPKIREKLRRGYSEVQTPAISTVHAVLFRQGLVNRGRKRRPKAQGTALSQPLQPNDLWCADYKGEFMLADRRYCYPLTISDSPAATSSPVRPDHHPAGVCLHGVRARVQRVRPAAGDPHRQRRALRQSQCPLPLEQARGLVAAPGHPHRNASSPVIPNRMAAMKEATKPAAQNFLQQQAKFDDFIDCYNQQRPHQALNMKYPAELYRPSRRPYRGLAELEYPFHDRTVTVTHCGRICLGKRKINLSQAFAGQNVGIKEVSDRIWLVTFMHYDLGFFDHEACRLEPVDNPFERKCYPCLRYKTLPM